MAGSDAQFHISLATGSATLFLEYVLQDSGRWRYASWSNMFWKRGFSEQRTLDVPLNVIPKR